MPEPGSANQTAIFNRLCHLVVLTRQQTVAQITDELLLALFGVDPALTRASVEDVAKHLEAYFYVRLNPRLLADSVGRLVAAGRLAPAPGGGYEIERATHDAVTARVDQTIALERRVRDEWFAQLGEPLNAERARSEVWRVLQHFIARAFLAHGAETALLLTPELPMSPSLEQSMGALLEEAVRTECETIDKESARIEVRGFFRDASGDRVSYLAQLMDGAFTLFALSVDQATARYLKSKLAPLAVFLDTNFIFGILGVNDHPDAVLANELVELVERERFPFKLYYHEQTLAEIGRTIEGITERLVRGRWQAAMSRAAVLTNLMSDIELRYHELNAKHPTDPEIFMSKYRQMDVLLNERGFVIFRSHESDEEAKRRALLVAEYEDYLKTWRPARPKPYPAMNHDMAVWLAVEAKRRHASNALDSGAIFLTMDHWLYRFDSKKLRKTGETATVVLPRQFLQLLRPFSAANEEYDRRFVETFATPEVRSLRAIPPGTASRVLSYLNTYKDVSEQTAIRMLTNDVVLAQVGQTPEGSVEFAAVIESALADDNRLLLEEREQLRTEHANAEAALGEERRLRVAAVAAEASARERAEAGEKSAASEAARAREIAAQQQLALDDVNELRRQLERARVSRARFRTAIFVIDAILGVALILGIAVLLVGPGDLGHHADFPRLVSALVAVWLGGIWAYADSSRRRWSIGVVLASGLVVLLEAAGVFATPLPH